MPNDSARKATAVTEKTVRLYISMPKSSLDLIDAARNGIPRNRWAYRQLMRSIGQNELADYQRDPGRPKKIRDNSSENTPNVS
jgi:hypothetical protein